MLNFSARIDVIGINPFVFVPDPILKALFERNGKNKGPIPVSGMINDIPYQQTLVKYSGEWRLYINTKMLKDSPKRIGETITVTIEFDSSERKITPHPKLLEALDNNPEAKEKFMSLAPSLQNEIIRYISSLKTETSVDRNVKRAIGFLMGKESFIGRKPLK